MEELGVYPRAVPVPLATQELYLLLSLPWLLSRRGPAAAALQRPRPRHGRGGGISPCAVRSGTCFCCGHDRCHSVEWRGGGIPPVALRSAARRCSSCHGYCRCRYVEKRGGDSTCCCIVGCRCLDGHGRWRTAAVVTGDAAALALARERDSTSTSRMQRDHLFVAATTHFHGARPPSCNARTTFSSSAVGPAAAAAADVVTSCTTMEVPRLRCPPGLSDGRSRSAVAVRLRSAGRTSCS